MNDSHTKDILMFNLSIPLFLFFVKRDTVILEYFCDFIAKFLKICVEKKCFFHYIIYMLLAIEIGNTNIVVALFDSSNLLHSWRIFSDIRRTGDEYESILRPLLQEEGISYSAIDSSVLSSVVPDLIGPFVGLMERITGKKPLIVNPQIFSRLPITIPETAVHEIGSDLVCNAVEAYCRFKGPCIIVDFGTALTFIAVGGGGYIHGVAIAPGIGTAIQSLFTNTSQLPVVPLVAPATTLGTNTIQSIQAGVILGWKGLVESLVERMKNELAEKEHISSGEIQVIATGGLNSVLQPITDVFQQIDRQLTLYGLKRISDLMQQEN
jgi:type III pantothenate kinase